MIISHTVMPPGGWTFRTERGINLVGETFDLLKKNVTAHFIANGLPSGDVENQIERQLVHRFPHLKKEKVLA